MRCSREQKHSMRADVFYSWEGEELCGIPDGTMLVDGPKVYQKVTEKPRGRVSWKT